MQVVDLGTVAQFQAAALTREAGQEGIYALPLLVYYHTIPHTHKNEFLRPDLRARIPTIRR